MIEPANSAAVEDPTKKRPISKASEQSKQSKVSVSPPKSAASGKKKGGKKKGGAAGGAEGDTPKKKKKMSKKELARLKREQAEQERLEQERRDAELRDQKEREYEQKKREEQQQRLVEEDAQIKRLRESRVEEGRRIGAEQNQTEDWQIFTQCDHFIDTRSTSDVNTFITTWDEKTEDDLKVLFERIQQSNIIISNLTTTMQKAEVSQDTKQFERCKEQIENMRNLVNKKIEEITIHHLVFSDKFAGAKNEVQVNASADGITYGMWVNLSKNPRNKDIIFPGVKIEIPKAVAMTSIAIRVIRQSNKPFNSEYLFLDKMLKCEFLQLPTPPKHVGSMTLRQSPKSNSLTKINYPLKNINAAQPPLMFTVGYQPGVITDQNKDSATIIVLTDDGKTSTTPITKVSIDQEEYVINFSSMCIGTFALAVPRYQQFPLEYWELTSTSATTFEIYVKTSCMELSLEINGNGKVSMEQPYPFKELTPVSAVEFLLDRGLNIVAPTSVNDINPKSADLEAVLAQGIADTGTGFVVRWSKWNAMLPADRAMLLMMERKDFTTKIEEDGDENDDNNNEEEDHQQSNNEPSHSQAPSAAGQPNENGSNVVGQTDDGNVNGGGDQGERKEERKKKKTNFRAILVKANHIVEVPNTEFEEECVLKPLSEEHIHQHLLPMFLQDASTEVKERVKNCPSFLCDAVFYFLKQLRLFSMTK